VFYYLPSGTAGGVEETRKCPTITDDLDGVHAMQCIHSFTFLWRPLNSGVPCTGQEDENENTRVKASGRDLSSGRSWSRFKYRVSTPHPVGCSNWPETLSLREAKYTTRP
jgi:hypothetical protein